MANLGAYIIYIVLATSLIGIYFYKKLPNVRAKSLLGLVLLELTSEFVGRNIFDWTGIKNYIVFNIYLLIVFNYYLSLLYSLLAKPLYKRLSIAFLFLCNVIYILDIVALQFIFEEMLTYFFAAGTVLLLILSCLYLTETFNSNKVMHFKKSIYFWFILGILIFHIPFLPLMITVKLFITANVDDLFSVVLFTLNLFMYTSFIIGFICTKKKYNY